MELEEKTLSTDVIHEGIVTDYLIKEVELPNGKKATREIVLHAPAASVLAITKEGKAVFVKQYRKAIEQAIYEIPAGLVDNGEEPLMAAQRELSEETGYQAGDWKVIAEFYTSVGFCNEYLYVYEATDLSKLDQALELDEDEFLEVVELSYEEAMEKYRAGYMPDSKTVVGLMHWKSKLK